MTASFDTLYCESRAEKEAPRALFMDLEPLVTDNIPTEKYHSLFHPHKFLSKKEDSANNYP